MLRHDDTSLRNRLAVPVDGPEPPRWSIIRNVLGWTG